MSNLFRRKPKKSTKELISIAKEELRRVNALGKELKKVHGSIGNPKRGGYGFNSEVRKGIDEFQSIYRKIKELEAFQRFDTKKIIELVKELKRREANPRAVHYPIAQRYESDLPALNLIRDDERLQKLVNAETLTMDKLVSRALAHLRKLLNEEKPTSIATTFILKVIMGLNSILQDEINKINQEIRDLDAALYKEEAALRREGR